MAYRSRTVQSSRFVARQRKRFIWAVILFIVAIASCVTTVVFFVRLPYFQIDTVTVFGNTSLETGAIVASIEQVLLGEYVYFIPRRNIFFYPKDAIAQAVKTDFSRAKEVVVERSGGTVSVGVTERAPVAVVCGGDSSDCVFTDDQAILFDTASDEHHLYTEVHTLDADTLPDVGEQFMTVDRFHSIMEFTQSLSKLGFLISRVNLKEGNDIDFVSKVGTTVRVRDTLGAKSFDTTLENLILFLDKAGKKVVFTSIDLRYGNSVFYKTVGTTTVPTASTTSRTVTTP